VTFNGSSPSIKNDGGNGNGGAGGGGGDDGMYASIKCCGWDGNCTRRDGIFCCWSFVDVVENSLLPTKAEDVDNDGE
jgi:hypothetical protein